MKPLETIYDSRLSFYRKAMVEYRRYVAILYSYNTKVCVFSYIQNVYYLYAGWDTSATTLRHIREFLQQQGFPKLTKAQIREQARRLAI